MAGFKGKSTLSVNGVEIGQCEWTSDITTEADDIVIEFPKIAPMMTIEVKWEPEAIPLLTDLCLQSQLGKHYKN